jgi:hypothetical protein
MKERVTRAVLTGSWGTTWRGLLIGRSTRCIAGTAPPSGRATGSSPPLRAMPAGGTRGSPRESRAAPTRESVARLGLPPAMPRCASVVRLGGWCRASSDVGPGVAELAGVRARRREGRVEVVGQSCQVGQPFDVAVCDSSSCGADDAGRRTRCRWRSPPVPGGGSGLRERADRSSSPVVTLDPRNPPVIGYIAHRRHARIGRCCRRPSEP